MNVNPLSIIAKLKGDIFSSNNPCAYRGTMGYDNPSTDFNDYTTGIYKNDGTNLFPYSNAPSSSADNGWLVCFTSSDFYYQFWISTYRGISKWRKRSSGTWSSWEGLGLEPTTTGVATLNPTYVDSGAKMKWIKVGRQVFVSYDSTLIANYQDLNNWLFTNLPAPSSKYENLLWVNFVSCDGTGYSSRLNLDSTGTLRYSWGGGTKAALYSGSFTYLTD